MSSDLAQSKNYNLTNQASQSFEAMISVFSRCRTRSSVMLRDMDVLTSNILQLINSQNRRICSINIFYAKFSCFFGGSLTDIITINCHYMEKSCEKILEEDLLFPFTKS